MKVAFIGLGRMGQAMAARLLGAGHELVVYNRTATRLAPLLAQGARAAGSAEEAARETQLVLTMLADDKALQTVMHEAGVLRALQRGAIHVAMGTHSVELIGELAAQHSAAGCSLVSAPVLGRPEAVTAGRATLIVAGAAEAVAHCRPVFEALGRRVFVAGPTPSAAAAAKLANNFLLACAIEAMGEAFALVRKCGMEAAVFREVISDGLFASPAYTGYARIIAEQAWDEVGFTVQLGLKDVNLALAAGQSAQVPLPSGGICRDRLLGALAHGDAGRDWAVMALEQARASGLA